MNNGIKIAIGGKGGVGKTTICAVLAQLFTEDGFDVLAIDADSDTNLASALGLSNQQHPDSLIGMKELIGERTGSGKEAVGAYFRLNPKVSDLPDKYSLDVNGVKLLVLGSIQHAGTGCACPESAFLKALLSHIVLQRQELVLVDLAAGVEFMGRASVSGIDGLIVVVEPGARSIKTALNIAKMAKEMGITHVMAVANKIMDASQIEEIQIKLTDIPILANIEYDSAIQRADMEQKNVFDSSEAMKNALKEAKKDIIALFETG